MFEERTIMAGQQIRDAKLAQPHIGEKSGFQNEQMPDCRAAIEIARQKYEDLQQKYTNLFDLAPVSYLVIDSGGGVREANLSAAVILNAPRHKLKGWSITKFIHRDDEAGFNQQKLHCEKYLETTVFELRMKKTDGNFFDARMQMQVIPRNPGDEPEFSVAFADIGKQVQLTASLVLQQNCLELTCNATSIEKLLEGHVKLVKSYLKCDAVGIRIREDAGTPTSQACDGFNRAFFESERALPFQFDPCILTALKEAPPDPELPCVTNKGSFYINGTSRFLATTPPAPLNAAVTACNTHGYESIALIPITIDRTAQGLIQAVDHKEKKFPLRVVETLENVGSRLGVAVHRFHLQEKLRESVDALNELSSHLVMVQENEQQRIAMELHDQCGQDLNVLKLRLKGIQNRLPKDATDLVEECDRLLAYSDKIINDIRKIAHGLKPSELEVLGLLAAVRQMYCEYSAHSNIKVETKLEALDQVTDPKVQITLFRIFQEALSNIYKHARATWVLVAAKRDGNIIRIRIEDNGIGFCVKKQTERVNGRKGMGLTALALRCRMISADLSIESKLETGTRITICLPCTPITAGQ